MSTLPSTFELATFDDKKNAALNGFVKRYSAYICGKLVTARQLGFDYCHVNADAKIKSLDGDTANVSGGESKQAHTFTGTQTHTFFCIAPSHFSHILHFLAIVRSLSAS
jgi:hypothetical protein